MPIEPQHPWIGQYILGDDGKPAPEPDLLTWRLWLGSHDRHVAQDRLPGGVRVSTVFLGLDQSFYYRSAAPVLWETMIFGGPHDLYQERYISREAAAAGHTRAVGLARAPGLLCRVAHGETLPPAATICAGLHAMTRKGSPPNSVLD